MANLLILENSIMGRKFSTINEVVGNNTEHQGNWRGQVIYWSQPLGAAKTKEKIKDGSAFPMAQASQVQDPGPIFPFLGRCLRVSLPSSLRGRDQVKPCPWLTGIIHLFTEHESPPNQTTFPTSSPRILCSLAPYRCPHSPLSVTLCLCQGNLPILQRHSFSLVDLKNPLPF